MKRSLEDEVISLKEQVNQLQDGYNSKAQEAASATTSQEEALSSSLSEISKLREECTAKMLKIESLESQMSAMKDNLEKEHQRWRTAHDNYERQVIIHSDTIKELTKTSQALDSIQEKAMSSKGYLTFSKTKTMSEKADGKVKSWFLKKQKIEPRRSLMKLMNRIRYYMINLRHCTLNWLRDQTNSRLAH